MLTLLVGLAVGTYFSDEIKVGISIVKEKMTPNEK